MPDQHPFSPTGNPTPTSGPVSAAVEAPTVINVLPADPKLAEPLPDAEITEILDGMMIPNEESVKRMAYEIKQARGGNPNEI